MTVAESKRVIISEREREKEVFRDPFPSQKPVPGGGTQGTSGECEAWGGGTKQTTVPQREALFWAGGGYKKSAARSMNGWMDGWPAVRMGAGSQAGKAGWAACPQSSHVRQPGQVWGMWGMIWKQSRLLSPGERPCPGLQGTTSQPLWTEEWMNRWLPGLLVDINTMFTLGSL